MYMLGMNNGIRKMGIHQNRKSKTVLAHDSWYGTRTIKQAEIMLIIWLNDYSNVRFYIISS
jgi:hypothetical protein